MVNGKSKQDYHLQGFPFQYFCFNLYSISHAQTRTQMPGLTGHNHIEIIEACEPNLKNISVSLPLNKPVSCF